MTVGVVIPTRAGDEWRAKALRFVVDWYASEHPAWPVVLGEHDDSEWSKGAAVAAGVDQLGAVDVYVIADADSFITDPSVLVEAVRLVESGHRSWVVPHRVVYRLRDIETERLYRDRTRRPRLNIVARTPYVGPAGGGITVVAADAYRTVGGIDPRFRGWGGEDVAFGWALETLVGIPHRLAGRLCHLWHPHPAPDLRGSPESEQLVAEYREARGYPRRMSAVVAGQRWEPLPPLAEPVRFRMIANRRTLRLFGSDVIIQFREGIYQTTDPDEVDALRQHDIIVEETVPR